MENRCKKIVKFAKTGEIGKNSWDRRASKKKQKKKNIIKTDTPLQKKKPKKVAAKMRSNENENENSPQVAIKRQWEIGPEIVRLRQDAGDERAEDVEGAGAGAGAGVEAAERCRQMELETATP